MSHNLRSEKVSFTLTLVSSASMKVFIDISLASFKSLLGRDIGLQFYWRVALTEITFPTHFNNVKFYQINSPQKTKTKQCLKRQ